MDNVTPIRPGASELPFGLPGGRKAKVPYVDEDRNYVDELVHSAICGVIEIIDDAPTAGATHCAADILRLVRERMEAEKERMKFTTYAGDTVMTDDDADDSGLQS